jgi:hypothetical protein
MAEGPRPPFDRWPVQRYDPVFGFAWYTEPGAFLTQITVVHGTIELVSHINDAIDVILEKHAPRLAELGGLLILHDFRMIKSYDSKARSLWSERMKRRRPGYSRGAIVCVADTPLLKMAVQGTNLLAALHVKTSVRLVDSLPPVLAAHGVQPPPPGSSL